MDFACLILVECFFTFFFEIFGRLSSLAEMCSTKIDIL